MAKVEEMDRLLRINEVEEIAGIKRATIYKWMSAGDFPPSVPVGKRSVRWKASVVREWIASRSKAA